MTGSPRFVSRLEAETPSIVVGIWLNQRAGGSPTATMLSTFMSPAADGRQGNHTAVGVRGADPYGLPQQLQCARVALSRRS